MRIPGMWVSWEGLAAEVTFAVEKSTLRIAKAQRSENLRSLSHRNVTS